MKLLPKAEVDRLKAVEKKGEIDEGLKLARRVDNLRETVAQEEASLMKFRRETVAALHEEITPLIKERDDLKTEVKQLTEAKAEAKKPLTEEWLKVADAKDEIDRRREAADARESGIAAKERFAHEIEADARNLAQSALSKEELAIVHLKDAAEAHERTEVALAHAQRIEESAKKVAAETEAGLINREQLVSTRENGVTIRETDLLLREKELADGWRLLRDREALFERNLKRKL